MQGDKNTLVGLTGAYSVFLFGFLTSNQQRCILPLSGGDVVCITPEGRKQSLPYGPPPIGAVETGEYSRMPLDYPNTVEVNVLQTLHGQPLINVLKFTNSAALTIANMTELAIAVTGWIGTDLISEFSFDLVWEGLIVTSLDLSAPYQYFHFDDFPVAGLLTVASLPVNVACMTRLHTGQIGASRKGRVYNSGLTEPSVDGNTLATGVAAGIQTAWYNLIAATALTTWDWVVASGMNQPGPGTGVTTPVIACQTDGRVHDMGRRLDNV